MSFNIIVNKFLTPSNRKFFYRNKQEECVRIKLMRIQRAPEIENIRCPESSDKLIFNLLLSFFRNRELIGQGIQKLIHIPPHSSPLYHRNGERDDELSRNPLQGLSYQNRTCYHEDPPNNRDYQPERIRHS